MSKSETESDAVMSELSFIRKTLCAERVKIIAILERSKGFLENEIVKCTTAIAEKESNAKTLQDTNYADESDDKALQSVIEVYHRKISILQQRVAKIKLDIDIETNTLNLDKRYDDDFDEDTAFSYWIFDNYCPICRTNKTTRNSIAFTVPCGHDICTQCFNEYVLHVSSDQGTLICPGCRAIVESVLLVQLDQKKGLRNSLSVRNLYERKSLFNTLLPQTARSIVEIWRFSSVRHNQ
ncbi:ring finger domain [Lissonota sp. PSUC_FEM 10030012]|nr:ring finger domain [Lissonota sp. PSUC_FEM 10030012]